MRKVETFTNDKVKVIIIWNTRKIQPLFNNKNFIYLLLSIIVVRYIMVHAHVTQIVLVKRSETLK